MKNIENKMNEEKKVRRKFMRTYIIGAVALFAGLGIAGYCNNKSALAGALLSTAGVGTMGYALYSRCKYDKSRDYSISLDEGQGPI